MAFFGKKKVPNQLGISVHTDILNRDLTVHHAITFNILPTKIMLSRDPVGGVVRNDISSLELHFKFNGRESIANRGIYGGGLGQQHVWVSKRVNKDTYIGKMFTNETASAFSIGYLRQLQEAGKINGGGNMALINYIFGADHQISPTIEIDLS